MALKMVFKFNKIPGTCQRLCCDGSEAVKTMMFKLLKILVNFKDSCWHSKQVDNNYIKVLLLLLLLLHITIMIIMIIIYYYYYYYYYHYYYYYYYYYHYYYYYKHYYKHY